MVRDEILCRVWSKRKKSFEWLGHLLPPAVLSVILLTIQVTEIRNSKHGNSGI
jgi:hypothetical protein